MFGLDIGDILKNMLPEGVTVEKLTEQAGQIAQQMIKTAHTVERVEQLLIALNAKVDAYQAQQPQDATVTPNVKESNNDNGNVLSLPGNPASGPGTGNDGNPVSVNGDGDCRSAGTCDCIISGEHCAERADCRSRTDAGS